MTLKIKHFLVLCVFALSTSMTLMAQDKQLTLHDLLPGGKTHNKFVPASLKQLQWCGDTYLYVKGDSMICGVPEKKEQVAFTRSRLNEALSAAGLPTVGSLPGFSVPYKDQPVLAFTSKGHRLHYNFAENKIIGNYQLDNKGSNYNFCPANNCLAFTVGNNIQILSPENQTSIVTRETKDGIVCGQAVHQREFGISKGLFWSPAGSALAFYRMDESMVTDYPIVNIDARQAKAEPVKYPMAGMKSHEVTVGVYNLSTGETVWLETGTPKEKFLTNIAWSPDEKSIYIAELNREQNEMNLVRYSALTGKKEAVLFTETNEHYVEPQYPVLFLPNDPGKFIWQSQKDGYNHLYLYDTTGKLIRQLTEGKWLVSDILGFNEKKKEVLFSANDATGRNNFSVNIRTGERSLPFSMYTTTEGVHNAIASNSGRYVIDNYSTPTLPRKIDIIDTQTGKSVNLLTAANPFLGFKMPVIETGTIKAADGVTDIYYRLIKPADMDPNKKYPAIVYVYGGPHAQMVTGGWQNGARGWDIYMANKGYIMFTIDNRGSSNRGLEFENVTFRHLGIEEGKDQVKGVEYLQSLPYVDGNRIGVHGWSFGGHMTTALLLRYPEIFKVGVAGGPVIDWAYYEKMYGERYMDTPQSNPEGYEQCNLKNLAGNLKGHLLIIHDDHDDTCVPQHTLSFMKACIDARTYPDLFIYPGHKHNVMGRDRIHLHEKITRYFEDNL